MPAGAVYVGRPSQWGNPFKPENFTRGVIEPTHRLARMRAVKAYRYEIVQMNGGIVGFNRFWVARHLRGKDLACWCPLDQPCHADVLLKLANS